MKKAILVLSVLTASTTAMAKDIAMPEEYLCFAVYDHIQYVGEQNGNRNLARSGHNSKAKLTQKYMMKIGGIVDGKSALNQYTGPGKSKEAWSNLIDRCDRKIR